MTQNRTRHRFRPSSGEKANRNRPTGFTLVEILAVVFILAILAAILVWTLKPRSDDVYVKETKNTMNIAMTAITEYYQVRKDYPAEGGGWVNQLLTVPKSRALISKFDENVWSAADSNEIKDAWGHPIEYSRSGGLAGAPGLISGGPDGDTATEEDNVRYNR